MAEPIDLSSIKEAQAQKKQGGVDLASPAQRVGREFLQAVAQAGEGPIICIGLTSQGIVITHTCSNSIMLRGLVTEGLDMALAGLHRTDKQQAAMAELEEDGGSDDEPRPTAT